VLHKLKEGIIVQDSSTELMTFIVQDLLDYAQIQAGKFRKNIGPFDIRQAVEQVMCIQRQKAQDQSLKFFATFKNIDDDQMNDYENSNM
jgi:signal transduction histidine kinase